LSVFLIDVASYQSDTYPTAGLAGVIVKCTEGTGYENPRYAAQVAHGRAAGLVVGHYHYGHAGDGTAQADYFLARLHLRAGDILALDWEERGMTEAERDAFIRRVKQRAPGHKVVLYCNLDFWRNLDHNNGGPMDGLWIADPNHSAGHPGIKHGWVFDQYASPGGMDREVANFPSVAAFRAWCGGLTPVDNGPGNHPKPPAPPVVTPPAPKPVPAPDPLAALEHDAAVLAADIAALKGKVK
jgi:hypothetical protein